MLVKLTVYKIQKNTVDSETDRISEGCISTEIEGGNGAINKESCSISDRVGDGVSVVLDLKCNGKHCARYRVRFNRCLQDISPVKEHMMQELAVNNHWMNGRVFEFTTNKEKYSVLYGWYAQNVYITCGLRNWYDNTFVFDILLF